MIAGAVVIISSIADLARQAVSKVLTSEAVACIVALAEDLLAIIGEIGDEVTCIIAPGFDVAVCTVIKGRSLTIRHR